jgi:phage terminase large subunit-like protein
LSWGTLDDFLEWTSRLILDTGENWKLEPFQEEIVADLIAGYSEIWALVPEGNGKTTLWGGIALYHAQHTPSAFVPVGASSREQAEIMYRQAEGFVFRTPGLLATKKSDTTGFRCQEGYRRIKALETGGRIQVYAADDRTADGVIPTLALPDELHRHRNLRLYRTWRGKLEKRGGQIATISTAGEPESEFEETRDKILKEAEKIEHLGPHGAHIRAEGEDIVLHDWAVRNRAEFEDMEVVAAANPREAITVASLAKKRGSPTMTDAHWLRFVCNIAARESGQAITPEEWDALADDPFEPEGDWVCGWLDLGWKVDTTAMGMLRWHSVEKRFIEDILVLEPPVDEADIVRGLVERQRKHGPIGWVYDPNAGGQQMAQMLEKGEHPQQDGEEFTFIEHSQDNAPMSLAATRADEAVRNGWLRHDGNKTLRKHALNTVRKSLGGEKWKYDRPAEAKGAARQRFPIDAWTGVLMGNSVAVAENQKPQKKGAHFF